MSLSGKEKGSVNIETSVYCYRMNSKSATHKKDDASIVRHTEDLFLLASLYKERIDSGEITNPEKLENTKQRQYAAVQGALTILPCTSLNRRTVFKRLKDEGLYPYPIITWPIKDANSIKGKIVEAMKLGFANEIYYFMYYRLRKFVSKKIKEQVD